jgi:hypothetical protein
MVVFEENIFYTVSISNALYISTIAREKKEETVIFSAIVLPSEIDLDLKIKLAAIRGVSYKGIEKRKTTIGAPLFYYQEELLTKSCSISHHGNYGAYAFNVGSKF